MTRRILLSLIVVGGMAISASVAAQNWRFLRDAPITFFTPRDVELFRANLRDTLDNAKDGERRSWLNSASGAGGSVTPEETSRQGETVCRRVRLDNSAKGHGGFTRKTFCKRAGRDWQVQP
jgi:hypothetical protein